MGSASAVASVPGRNCGPDSSIHLKPEEKSSVRPYQSRRNCRPDKASQKENVCLPLKPLSSSSKLRLSSQNLHAITRASLPRPPSGLGAELRDKTKNHTLSRGKRLSVAPISPPLGCASAGNWIIQRRRPSNEAFSTTINVMRNSFDDLGLVPLGKADFHYIVRQSSP